MLKQTLRKSCAFLFAAAGVLLVFVPLAQAQTPRSDIRVQLTPQQSTLLSAEIAGRIATISVKEGETFQEGQTLLSMDCSLHQARLDKALALSDESRQVLTVNQQLDRLGSISVLEVGIAEARLAGAEAEASLMSAIVDRCEIIAPFSGKVSALSVKAHQFVAEGQELIGLLDDSSMDVEMMVPSRWLPQLRVGQEFSLQIDETGQQYPARIERLGALIDAVSQSVKVFGTVVGSHPELTAGMSGTAVLLNP
ncbi:MAG: efflux RND transporter periplasmic adaptor subunit [Pseudohongiella sp.]|nr:efflux RND transporter periplasmic adaptor subunit [Pseudohongiella sp.]